MANFFKTRREELNVSQFAMAIRIGVTPGLVSMWDRSKLVPSKPIAKLALAYETTTDRIEQALIEVRREVEAANAREARAAKRNRGTPVGVK